RTPGIDFASTFVLITGPAYRPEHRGILLQLAGANSIRVARLWTASRVPGRQPRRPRSECVPRHAIHRLLHRSILVQRTVKSTSSPRYDGPESAAVAAG